MPCIPSVANSWGEMWRSLSLKFISMSCPSRTVAAPLELSAGAMRWSEAIGLRASLLRRRVDLARAGGAGLADLDGAHPAFHRGPHQIDVQEAVVEPGTRHFDAFGEHERALELPRGDAAMQVDALAIVVLLAAHHQLVVLDLDREVSHGETGHRQRDAQRVLAGLLDIVGRIAVRRRLAD